MLEARDIPGGKARSLPVPGSATGGRADLPAEHGFRFFPGFYQHLPDTMRRIPAGGRSVFEHLVGAERILLAQAGGRNEIIAPAHAAESLDDLAALSRFLLEVMTGLGMTPADHAWLMDRLLTLLTSCDARRYEQWETASWWVYVKAEQRSDAFKKFLAEGLTRTLVAARAREISARTGGLILAQLIFDLTRAGARADRVLNAPTNAAWIDPWVAHIRGLGVDLRLQTPVQGITVRDGRIAGVTTPGGTVTADFYVAALPVERMRIFAGPPLRALDPRLAALDKLVTRWMNGVLFYLDRDVPLVKGHAIYIDSEWALTSISQAQFWKGVVDLERYGDGRVKGILSVDVSDWTTPGRRTGKVAMECSRDEIRAEVWGQLTDHLNDGPQPVLDDHHVLAWFLDPAIQFPNPTQATNLEPLLINTAGSWADRPGRRDRDPEPRARRRLRAHEHRPRDDGGRQRGGAPRGERDPRRRRIGADVCEVFPLREPKVLVPGAQARRAALEAVPPPGADTAPRGRRRRRRAANRLSRALLSAGRLTR